MRQLAGTWPAVSGARAPAGERMLRHEYVPLGEKDALSKADRAELRALCAGGGPPEMLPELVECLAQGGVAPIVRSDGTRMHQRYGFVLVRDARGIVAAAAVLSTSEVLFDLLAGDGLLRAAGNLVRAYPKRLGARTLCVGTPLCQEGGALFRKGVPPPEGACVLEPAVRATARSLGCQAVLWKDVDPESPFHASLLERGYRDFPTLPGATIPILPHRTLHDYLEWIGSVASYGDLRRKMRAGSYDSPGLREHLLRCTGTGTGTGTGIQFDTVRDPPERMLEQMHALYRAQLARAQYRWETLTPHFFRTLAALPEASFTVARAGENVLGFSLSVIVGDRFVALRSGVRAGVDRALSLPSLLVLRDIETALQAGCRAILLGPTGYALKARFGAIFKLMASMLRMLPPWGMLTRPVAAAIEQANRRAGIADLHKTTFKTAWAPQVSPWKARQSR